MTNWIQNDDQDDLKPADLSELRRLMGQLEDCIAATAKTRRTIDEHYPASHPARQLVIHELRDEATRRLADLKERATKAFDSAQEQARTNANRARQQFARSDDGREYLTALAGFSALAASMGPDALAERLNALLDAGLVGQARAMAEVSELRTAQPGSRNNSGKLAKALNRAANEARTPLEAAADADVQYLDRARLNYNAFAGQAGGRLQEALTRGRDYGQGNFTDMVLK